MDVAGHRQARINCCRCAIRESHPQKLSFTTRTPKVSMITKSLCAGRERGQKDPGRCPSWTRASMSSSLSVNETKNSPFHFYLIVSAHPRSRLYPCIPPAYAWAVGDAALRYTARNTSPRQGRSDAHIETAGPPPYIAHTVPRFPQSPDRPLAASHPTSRSNADYGAGGEITTTQTL
jgi:hypothetical protein